MKATEFTEEQIALAIRQAEACRKIGILDVAFYNWKKKYGGGRQRVAATKSA